MKNFTEYLKNHALIFGISFVIGCGIAATILGNSIVQFKKLERTVVVKGLSEKEVPANVAVWTIRFNKPSNDLIALYNTIEKDITLITNFMTENGIEISEITIAPPNVTDKQAFSYNERTVNSFRYVAEQNITLYSSNIALIRSLSTRISELGKEGISFIGNNYYDNPIKYLYTDLNSIKPEMVKEATEQARQVALEFAHDSQSKLGKIKRASQGQFTISDRDANNPHIKTVRIVSTIEYYLSD